MQMWNLVFLMKKHVFSMQIDWVLIWDFISENSSFWEIWGKMLDRKPKQVSEKEWKRVTFSSFLCNKTFEVFVGLLPLIWYGISKRAFLMKKTENWWKMSDFLSLFCEILPTNLKFIFFALFPHLIRDIIAFMCENHVFFVCFRMFFVHFGRLGWILESVWRGDYRGEVNIDPRVSIILM